MNLPITKRLLNLILATALFWSTCIAGIAHAKIDMISTEAAILHQGVDTRNELHTLLSRDDVRNALESAGISSEEAKTRVNALSQMELARIQKQLDELPAGAGVGSLVGAAVFIFVVLLITDILGYTDVFTFVKK